MTRLFAGTQWDQPPQCDRCDKLESECQCPPIEPPQTFASPESQTAQVVVEKRKRGKLVTVVRGLAADQNDLPALLTRLKTECGAGGTIKDEAIEIQGDHTQRIGQSLESIGYRVKG